MDDIEHIHEIAIQVLAIYSGNPAELVKRLPLLSAEAKKKLRDKGKKLPKQPDVQLLIEWKAGFKPEFEEHERFIS